MDRMSRDFDSTFSYNTNQTETDQGTKPKILIIEDDVELRTVIEEVLKSINPKTRLDWATNAERGIENLKKTLRDKRHPFYDLIIADIFLDGESTGIDFWNICLEVFPNIPFIITSGLSLEKFSMLTSNHSASPAYLQKPFTINECRMICLGMLT